MPDESPSEREQRLGNEEERLQRREERLTRAHERQKEKAGGGGGGGGVGSAIGGVGEFFGEHKILVIGAGVVILGGIIVYQLVNANNSSASGGTANQSPDYAASGIMTSNISSALDSMNTNLEALDQQLGTSGSQNNANPSSSFQWPSALQGMKVWEGTSSHQFFFGPNGPQPGRAGQTPLSSLFPTGTTFLATTGKAGSQLYYEVPGGTFQLAPVTLVNPTPSGLRTISH